MRKMGLYVIYDTVSELFHGGMMQHFNVNEAKRAFTLGIKDHARYMDLSIFQIGVYDRVDGTIEAIKPAKLIMSGLDAHRSLNKEKETK